MRIAIIFVTALMMSGSFACRTHASFELPGVMLWAWQRPEDLRFIDTRTTGVAYLAGTARIAPDGVVEFEPRLQLLKVPASTGLLAVVRIEDSSAHAGMQTASLLESIKQVVRAPGIRGLQIDFDARVSERRFYRSLLDTLKEQSPVPVGVTALASWCEGDRWLDDTGVAEAVPMFFRMGKDETRNMNVLSRVCRSSVGLSMDEPWPLHRPSGVKRIYLFSPRAWDRDVYFQALQRIRDWK